MKIPESLKIGGHVVRIVFKKLENMNGESDYETNTIFICSTLPQSQKEVTLIHEVFHFMNSTFSDKDLGHIILDSLAEQFYQVLKDNKLIK